MEKLLIVFLIMPVTVVGLFSCNKTEEVPIQEEEIKAYLSEKETLELAMKKTSKDVRRLARGCRIQGLDRNRDCGQMNLNRVSGLVV